MAPTRIGYNAAVLRRGLWLNAGIVLLGMVYFALNGLSFARWADLIILVVLVYYSYKLVRGLAQLLKAPPAVVISDEGIWDASLGARPVPWAAIREIKSVPRKGRLGGGLFLVLDTSKLAFTPGSFGFRVANAIGRAVASAMSARKDGGDGAADDAVDRIGYDHGRPVGGDPRPPVGGSDPGHAGRLTPAGSESS